MSDRADAPTALAAAIAGAYPGWLERDLTTRLAVLDSAAARDAVSAAARLAAEELDRELAKLLAADVDAQRANPLQVIREVTARAAQVLDRLGVPAAARDAVEARAMPEDRHGLGPLAWRDLGDDVHEAGIVWGAWKAATVLSRRRAEGKLDP